MTTLHLFAHDGSEAILDVPKEGCTIGKWATVDGRPNQVVLEGDPTVSRRHARIVWRNGHAYLEDLQSRNRTWLNDRPVTRARLSTGDRIRIGRSLLVVADAASCGGDDPTIVAAGDGVSATIDLTETIRQRVDAAFRVDPPDLEGVTAHLAALPGIATVRIAGDGDPAAVGEARLPLGASRWLAWSVTGDGEAGELIGQVLNAAAGELRNHLERRRLEREARAGDLARRHLTAFLERLQHSEALPRVLLEGNPDLMLILDGEGTIRYCKPPEVPLPFLGDCAVGTPLADLLGQPLPDPGGETVVAWPAAAPVCHLEIRRRDAGAGQSLVIVRDVTRLVQAEERQARLSVALRDALGQLNDVGDLVPICSCCKKIRDDRGFWEGIETYLSRHADLAFSHGLCDACAEAEYGPYFRKGRG